MTDPLRIPIDGVMFRLVPEELTADMYREALLASHAKPSRSVMAREIHAAVLAAAPPVTLDELLRALWRPIEDFDIDPAAE